MLSLGAVFQYLQVKGLDKQAPWPHSPKYSTPLSAPRPPNSQEPQVTGVMPQQACAPAHQLRRMGKSHYNKRQSRFNKSRASLTTMTPTNIFMGSVLLLDEFNFPHGLESMLELTLGQVVGGAAKSYLRRSGGEAHTQGQTEGGQADPGGDFLAPCQWRAGHSWMTHFWAVTEGFKCGDPKFFI